jgi:hypothetical protein
LLFCITNSRLGIDIYAGVQEFKTQPGHLCLPYWMIEYLQIDEEALVNVTTTQLPTATRAVFQPPDDSFLSLPNPRVILECTLRLHPCLTQGSVIAINFNKKIYRLKVLKTEPSKAVATLETDVECDFATPLCHFSVHWSSTDSDSSDDREQLHPIYGTTCNGRLAVQQPKPLRKIYAEREKERAKQRESGYILPRSEPPQTKPKADQKKALFSGQGRTIRKSWEEGQADSSTQQPLPKKSNAFQGPSRKLDF